VEVGFYLLLPIFAALVARLVGGGQSGSGGGAFGARLGREWLAIGLFAAVGIGALLWRNYGTDWTIGSGSVRFRMLAMPEWFAMFAAGMALAVCWVRYERRSDDADPSNAMAAPAQPVLPTQPTQPGWWRFVGEHPAICWLGALGLFTLLNQGLGLVLGEIEPWQWVVRHVIHIAVALLLLAPVVSNPSTPSRLRRLLAHPRMQAAGLASYGVYLWHIAILEVLARGFDGIRSGVADETIIVGLLGLWLSIVAGTLSYRFIEEPTRRLAQRVGSRWAAPR
jgi:peptidoglycan/LPS O-acetylase OafA/YrhL